MLENSSTPSFTTNMKLLYHRIWKLSKCKLLAIKHYITKPTISTWKFKHTLIDNTTCCNITPVFLKIQAQVHLQHHVFPNFLPALCAVIGIFICYKVKYKCKYKFKYLSDVACSVSALSKYFTNEDMQNVILVGVLHWSLCLQGIPRSQCKLQNSAN